MPFVPDTSTPASKPIELIVIDLGIVTAPKPPGSSTLISPAGAVLEIAPANVLHGAVRLHGLASSPTPDTHVRVACAFAGTATSIMATRPQHCVAMDSSALFISMSLFFEFPSGPGPPTGGSGAIELFECRRRGECAGARDDVARSVGHGGSAAQHTERGGAVGEEAPRG